MDVSRSLLCFQETNELCLFTPPMFVSTGETWISFQDFYEVCFPVCPHLLLSLDGNLSSTKVQIRPLARVKNKPIVDLCSLAIFSNTDICYTLFSTKLDQIRRVSTAISV